MRKVLYIVVSLWFAGTMFAQKPHSYSCDFESASENATWKLNTPKNESYTWLNQWAIGSATSSLGAQSMYISPDSGKNVGYQRDQSKIMIAWRELDLEAGRYDVAFDWMCGGDSARSALLVAWVPQSQFNDVVCKLNDDYKSARWINDNMLKFQGSELLTGGSVWTHAVNSLETDGTPHRLIFCFVNSSSAQLVQPGPCVDNIQLSRNNCGCPTNMKSSVFGQTAKLEWESTAQSFNLRIHRMGDSYATILSGITQNSFSSSLPEGIYDIHIQTICDGDTSVWYNFPTAFVYETKCFDYLDLTDERCSFSPTTPTDYHYIDQLGILQKGRIDFGFTSASSRHTIHFHPEEYDSRTRNSVNWKGDTVPMLKTVPEGALASVRVGSWEKAARVARVEYDFVVDAREASVLMLQYAMVLESSGHPDDIMRPRMTIDIVDYYTGAALSTCTTVNLASQTTGEGWNRVPDPAYPDGSRDVCWRDWTTLGLNLAEFDGRHVKVKITTYGCNASIHYGYAYFTLTCTSGQIKGIHCGWTPTRQFIAPEGFNYRWYKVTQPKETLGRNNIYDVDYKDTCTYAVDITYKSDAGCGFTLYANAIPRFPIPEATYKLEQRDCGNYITFKNTSHIRTRNWTTGEEIDTPYPAEYVVWDFDGLIPEGLDTPDKLWNPSFRLPDEAADYHFSLRAVVGLCDSIQEFDIHVPRVGKDSIIDNVQLCEGDIYRHNGKYYQSDTVIIDHDYNIAGCDSFYTINLRFVDAIRDTIMDTIPEGESYTIGDQTFTQPGEYSVTLPSAAGCDSIITLYLEVVAPLLMEISSVESSCPEDASFLIYTHARKGKPDWYELTFSEAAEAIGLEAQSDSLHGGVDNTIEVPLPANAEPGYYTFSIRFDSQVNGETVVAGELMIHYSSSFIQQRWDDVLGVLNADYNGGYDFRTFQWYRNGIAIEGANEPYLYVEEKLKAGDKYAVELKLPGEEKALSTCEYEIPASANTAPAATPQKRLQNGSIFILVNGSLYNAYGQKIK